VPRCLQYEDDCRKWDHKVATMEQELQRLHMREDKDKERLQVGVPRLARCSLSSLSFCHPRQSMYKG
jgi:hypothetical protein